MGHPQGLNPICILLSTKVLDLHLSFRSWDSRIMYYTILLNSQQWKNIGTLQHVLLADLNADSSPVKHLSES